MGRGELNQLGGELTEKTPYYPNQSITGKFLSDNTNCFSFNGFTRTQFLHNLILVITLSRLVYGMIGDRSAAEIYPFFVLVMKIEQQYGGTKIAPNAVLTAANCLYENENRRWALAKRIRNLHGNFCNKKLEWDMAFM